VSTVAATMQAVGWRHLHCGRLVVWSKDNCRAADQKLCDDRLKTHVLKGVLSVELTDITAKNVRAPDDGEVLRRHPGPL